VPVGVVLAEGHHGAVGAAREVDAGVVELWSAESAEEVLIVVVIVVVVAGSG
jgi:hypothetical protein